MIYKLKNKTSITLLCGQLGVTRTWFYKWLKSRESKAVSTLTPKAKILEEIKKSFERSDKTYGSPRVYDDLIEKGYSISENTVAKYMHKNWA